MRRGGAWVGHCVLLVANLTSDSECTDDSDFELFIVSKNYRCSEIPALLAQWGAGDCSRMHAMASQAGMGAILTQAKQDEIIANCPAACNLCSGGDADSADDDSGSDGTALAVALTVPGIILLFGVMAGLFYIHQAKKDGASEDSDQSRMELAQMRSSWISDGAKSGSDNDNEDDEDHDQRSIHSIVNPLHNPLIKSTV
ncbi:hypothetical protein CYMTET_10880 [Cymbomonas tetramitiformis]|uniref:Uncharacterized protein n=1 Tax=Cymbomonas tetramitiformis TaxID=36881 RepID=A0AAE0LDD9_9CHLO|nr:hypothetical protein CYMTET_10880 [Cymbomonas tetramitiformis]|eukprot:gene14302-16916_t